LSSPISVPTGKGVGSAFGDYAVGAGGALMVGLSQSVLGSGFWGSLLAPVLAASAIKGDRGRMLATIAGFFGIISLLGSGTAPASGSSANEAVD